MVPNRLRPPLGLPASLLWLSAMASGEAAEVAAEEGAEAEDAEVSEEDAADGGAGVVSSESCATR
jgi:hypothetical protein